MNTLDSGHKINTGVFVKDSETKVCCKLPYVRPDSPDHAYTDTDLDHTGTTVNTLDSGHKITAGVFVIRNSETKATKEHKMQQIVLTSETLVLYKEH